MNQFVIIQFVLVFNTLLLYIYFLLFYALSSVFCFHQNVPDSFDRVCTLLVIQF